MTAASSNAIGRIPIEKKVEHIEGEELIKAQKGKATLVVFNKESLISFESEVKYRISSKLNLDSKQIVVFGGIEYLHEKAHMDMLLKKIKENTTNNKIVVATAVKGKYNNAYLDKHFDFICPVKVVSDKKVIKQK